MKRRMKIINTAILAVALAGAAAHASSWVGLGIDNEFSTTNNWNDGLINGTQDINGDWVVERVVDNTCGRTFVQGGATLNVTGGTHNDSQSGSSIYNFIGSSSTGTVNQSAGTYSIGHGTRIGGANASAYGTYNLTGGDLTIYRGSNSAIDPTNPGGRPSLEVGTTATGNGQGLFEISGVSSLNTRGPAHIGKNGTFSIVGSTPASPIGIGSNGSGDGAWIQKTDGVLKVGIDSGGVTPILVDDVDADDDAEARFENGALLDVSFIGGYEETNYWTIMTSEGTMTNAGMIFVSGVDTNNWGFRVTNNMLQVGYGLGWGSGSGYTPPPEPQRTLYWTGNGGDTASDNPENWVLDVTALTNAVWGPYADDLWRIADGNVAGLDLTTTYVVDYDGTAHNSQQRDLEVGINGAKGTLNMNSGTLNFDLNSASARNEFGLEAGSEGTLNINGGTFTLKAGRFGINGGKGTLNVNGGTLNVARGYGDYGLWIGHGSVSTGIVNIAGGSLATRTPLKLGDVSGSAPSIFSVEGSAADFIRIGNLGPTLDGEWVQYSGTTLKIRIDAGGVTPIEIFDKGTTYTSGDGNASFYAGSLLDVDYVAGVSNIVGPFDIMTWQGSLVESNLAFAASVDTNEWSFAFVDTDADTTNDTLRVYPLSVTPTVDPNITDYSYDGVNVSLSWDSEPGFNYNVLSKADLVGSSWSTNVAAVPSAGSTTSATNVTPSGGSAEFFRIEAY